MVGWGWGDVRCCVLVLGWEGASNLVSPVEPAMSPSCLSIRPRPCPCAHSDPGGRPRAAPRSPVPLVPLLQSLTFSFSRGKSLVHPHRVIVKLLWLVILI